MTIVHGSTLPLFISSVLLALLNKLYFHRLDDKGGLNTDFPLALMINMIIDLGTCMNKK